MLISKAYAQGADVAAQIAGAPSAGEAFAWNMGLVLVLVVMFYILLIRPQQKRFKEHAEMLGALKKGDKVTTGGGLIGKIDKLTEGSDEVVIDLGNSIKVTALRSTISAKAEATPKPANDTATKKPVAKKTTAKKK